MALASFESPQLKTVLLFIQVNIIYPPTDVPLRTEFLNATGLLYSCNQINKNKICFSTKSAAVIFVQDWLPSKSPKRVGEELEGYFKKGCPVRAPQGIGSYTNGVQGSRPPSIVATSIIAGTTVSGMDLGGVPFVLWKYLDESRA